MNKNNDFTNILIIPLSPNANSSFSQIGKYDTQPVHNKSFDSH